MSRAFHFSAHHPAYDDSLFPQSQCVDKPCLFNIDEDKTEHNDVADSNPDVVQKVRFVTRDRLKEGATSDVSTRMAAPGVPARSPCIFNSPFPDSSWLASRSWRRSTIRRPTRTRSTRCSAKASRKLGVLWPLGTLVPTSCRVPAKRRCLQHRWPHSMLVKLKNAA